MPTTKHCPGARLAGEQVAGYPPHDPPVADFAKNAARPDGLSRVCRPCWKAYEAARKAAKSGEPPVIEEVAGIPVRRHRIGLSLGNAPTAEQAADREAARDLPASLLQIAGSEVPEPAPRIGWTTRRIGGLPYSIPSASEDIASEEGQAALAAAAEAVRKVQRDSKRAQRAAAKQRAEDQAS